MCDALSTFLIVPLRFLYVCMILPFIFEQNRQFFLCSCVFLLYCGSIIVTSHILALKYVIDTVSVF